MNKANYALRLQTSLKDAAEKAAAADGASLNQFINVAVAEKIAALETETYFRDRARKADERAFWSFLDEAGNE
ncbi:toxin-antitoxin system HicB family antitoxin, partial [Salmonella enterica subsp. enterica]|nr:toxin-antitoxin system HicB family antitoxin [Salmonella enterica subsp. enterica serovar Paratyphi A]